MELTHRVEEIEITVERGGASDELPFYSVSTLKFVLLSLATFTIYETFWFYKNWKIIKARTGSDISPFWRAIFSIVFCYPFAKAVDSATESANLRERIKPELINKLFIYTQPAHLQKVEKRLLEPKERDKVRADFLRGKVPAL